MILKKGMNSNSVNELQKLLDKHGFWVYHTFTNFFGDVTKTSVINFQKDKGLKVDGIVGNQTWKELIKDLKNNITPTESLYDVNEDFDDPEDEMVIEDIEELKPTCHNIVELINLINSENINRKIEKIIYHCTATQQNATVEGILKYWRENLGWKNPGYHLIVKPDGSWTYLHDFNKISNGVRGYNSTSINISYIGGVDENGKAIDNRTEQQEYIFENLYFLFKDKLPDVTFHGHNEFSNKRCPSYDVSVEIAKYEKNIDKTI